MKKWAGILLLILLLLAAVPHLATAQDEGQPGSRDPVFEAEVTGRLEKISSEAVPIFQAATAALDSGDFAAAQEGFQHVLELAPGFPDAFRRLSQAYYAREDIEQAEIFARLALTASESPENKAWLAQVLLHADTPMGNMEAFNLAKDAAADQPEDAFCQYVLMFASNAANQVNDLRQSSAAVVRLAPAEPWGHFFSGLMAAYDEKWEMAERELLQARKLGAPAADVQSLLDQGITGRARFQRVIRLGLTGLAGWAGTLGVLFLLGLLLSQITLFSVNRKRGLTSMEINPVERLVRQVYRVVIAFTSAYFFLSIPVLLLIILAAAGLTVYAVFAIGHIPIRIAVLVLIGCVYTLIAVVYSLLARRPQGDPGKELSQDNSIPLWDLLRETAGKVGTRPVDRVFLTPGTEIGVYERGGWWKRLRRQGERCLVLGLGALPGMNQGQLRAIIAHEYGHFSHADTAGGDLANTVSFNIQTMAQGLAMVGTATWYNPVWLFINGYYRIFLLITQGASRLQEILADRYAAIQYGVRNMKSGLEHVIRQNLLFEAQANEEIHQAILANRSLQNLYTLPIGESLPRVEEAFSKIMQEHTSAYASHPSPRDRLGFIERVHNSGLVQEDCRPVWDLLGSMTDLQNEMTLIIEINLRVQGILQDKSIEQPEQASEDHAKS
jgi:Zn-dependent protease with chaperone function